MTKKEKKQTIEDRSYRGDRDYWDKFGKKFGWKLHGWTYRSTAIFFTSKIHSIEINREQKEQIEKALEEAENKAYINAVITENLYRGLFYDHSVR